MREGDRVGDRYRLEGRAGAGGMGVVFRATDERTGQHVAVKVLSHLAGVSVERFRRETELLASLSHPGIVRYLDHGATEGGTPYLVMEWLEGRDLGRFLDGRTLGTDETLRLGAAIADAMGYLHAHEIVHRDLKPANVLLLGGDPALPRLLDFGIARFAGMQRLTRTGGLVGTPGYMAPEQARSDAATPASDVFALGAILFECLTGRPPFEGEHPLAVLTKSLLAEPPRLRELVPDAPFALDALLARMIAREPSARLPDGRAVREAIGVALAQDATSVDPPRDAPMRENAVASVSPRERSLVTLLVARSDEASDAEGPTLAGGLDGRGAHHLPDGSLVWLFTGADAPAIAAQTALDAHRASPAYRFALASGYVVVHGDVPIGAVTDRAVELLVRLSPVAIRVDETTARALPDRFEIVEEDGVHVLLGARETVVHARGRRAPFIGRESELAIIRGVAARSFGDRSAGAVLLRAETGMGKSRVLAEALEALTAEHAGARIVFADCDAQHMGAPFACIRRALERCGAFGRTEVDLERFAANHLDREDRSLGVAFLGELLRVPLAGHSREVAAAKLDPKLYVEQIQRVVTGALRGLASRGPVALVLEDAQLCDAPSFKLVETALRALRRERFLILATARPEIDEVFPGVFKALGAQVIRLRPLAPRASVRLAQALNADLAPERLEWLVARAEGNPLFIEELSRSTSDSAISLHAILAARLSQLPAEARRVMRAASVFGETAPLAGVEALLGPMPDTAGLVRELDAADVLRLVESPEPELTFHHALSCEVAYASLPDEDRQAAHLAAARWLEGRESVDAAQVAEHWVRGGDRERAVPALLAAAEVAIAAHDARAALTIIERAREQGAAGKDLGRLAAFEATARMVAGDMVASAERAAEAMERLPAGSAAWLGAAATGSVVLLRQGLASRAAELSERVIATVTTRGAPAYPLATLAMNSLVVGRDDLASQLMALLGDDSAIDDLARFVLSGYFGSLAVSKGDYGRAVREFTIGEHLGHATGDQRRLSAVLSNVGYALVRAGRFVEGEEKLRECIALSERIGAPGHRIYALGNLALALRARGRLEEAQRAAEDSVAAACADGERHAEVSARAYLALVLRDRGHLTLAEEQARAAETLAERAAPKRRFTARAVLASVLARQGRLGEARPIAERLRDALQESESHVGDEVDLRLAIAEVLGKCGETERAREEAEKAYRGILEMADRMAPGAERDAYLAVPEHELVRSLLAQP